MGIIQRQSIKNSFVNYIGVAIGAVSTIFIYPLLGAERLGIVQFFMTAVAFLVPFTAFGLPAVSVQFFSIFKNDTRKESTLLTTLMGFMGLTCIFILGLIYVFQDFFAGLFKQNAYLFSPYLNIIAVSTILFSFSTLFYTYAANYGRIAIPSVFFNLLQKVTKEIRPPSYSMLVFRELLASTISRGPKCSASNNPRKTFHSSACDQSS